ncbi:MAG TPA: glycoside hydrolase family 16 protein [Balneolaceae bacterium]|nr:glycoside hydrolase family 16 protein [Balneolaceae bacterium]
MNVNKRKFLLIALPFIFLGCSHKKSPQHPEIHPPKGYKLVWHDEFNQGSKPDTSTWSYEHGFVRNKELQWYQPENAYLKDDKLVIEGRRERVKNPAYDSTSSDWRKNRRFAHYTSASINTRGHFSFKYGILKVRARIDTAKGMWPAIWTLGAGKNHHWPAYGEIDVMEFYRIHGRPTILANAAWGGKNHQAIWDSKKVPFSHFAKKHSSWAQKFHVWKMDWTPKRIRIYLDGELMNKVDLSKTQDPDGFNPFHQPHYILLNLAIGANGGNPSHTKFPKKYEVDYVRVFQKKK